MKFITLEVLCKDAEEVEVDSENQSYKNVLEELNLTTASEKDSDTYWRPISFSLKVLEDELFSIEDRCGYEKDNCVISFFDSRTVTINKSREELVELLNDTK